MPLAPFFLALISSAVVKFISSMLLFLGVQFFISAFFDWGLAPAWMTTSGFTGGWASVLTSSNDALGSYGSAVSYLLNLFMIPYGLATLLNAHITRFIIRRVFK